MKHIACVTRKPACAKSSTPPIDVEFVIDVMEALLTKKTSLT